MRPALKNPVSDITEGSVLRESYEATSKTLLPAEIGTLIVVLDMTAKSPTPMVVEPKEVRAPLGTMKIFDAFYNLRIQEQLLRNISSLYADTNSAKITEVLVCYNNVLQLYTYLSEASKTISNLEYMVRLIYRFG